MHNNELELYYQPQYHLTSGKIVGAEVLLRWQHPNLGLLAPSSFLPIAEEIGTIATIGEWVLRTACARAGAWRDAGIPCLPRLSVNLSAQQFQRANLLELLDDLIGANKLPPGYLELEITEHIAMQDAERTVKLLRQLQQLGLRIAIDDFGTGYSSMGYLRRFPCDTLKIDRAFVRDIGSSASAKAVAQALVALGQGLNLAIVAEGVETEQQFETLKVLGCNAAQGYWLSRPVPEPALIKLLQTSPIATS